MLNQSAEYALRIAVHLAALEPDASAQASDIAAALDVPANYLSKVLHQLAAAGILASRRGRGGGFRLAKPPERLKLAAVVAPFEDVRRYRACLLGKSACSDRRPCPAHQHWQPVAREIADFLNRTSVADIGSGGRPR